MKKTALILLMACLLPTAALRSQSGRMEADTLRQWAHYLAGDEMKGRANGSPEMLQAAQFIAENLRASGLAPLPGLDGFFQEYAFTNRRGDVINERNVIAYLEGADPDLKNEYLVFSSHFDHVGIGRAVNGDSIYNGANDNVAGTVTIMGLARYWHENGLRPNRSVIFAAYSGEEMGLHGSRHFAAHLPFDIQQIYLNLNMEMTGHCSILGERTYYITGPAYTNLDELLDVYNHNTGWTRTDAEKNADRLFFASDNVSLAIDRSGEEMKLNIPAHTWCTHGGEDHIHKPHDEPQFMNYCNMADLVEYLSGLGLYFGQSASGLIEWDEVTFAEDLQERRRR